MPRLLYSHGSEQRLDVGISIRAIRDTEAREWGDAASCGVSVPFMAHASPRISRAPGGSSLEGGMFRAVRGGWEGAPVAGWITDRDRDRDSGPPWSMWCCLRMSVW
jgi:hypothetical protein